MPEEKIKVLLIEDSGLMRLIISDILRSDTTIDLVDTAENGKEGLEKVIKHKPHVVVTDLIMPHYDGLYAVTKIMEQAPTPIVVLSSLEKADPVVFDVLRAGAVNFVDKPKKNAVSGIREVDNQLIGAVKAASQANVLGPAKQTIPRRSIQVESRKLKYDVICIGSSTGGPGAVEKIIEKLPANLNIPLVIAQHMPESFLASFAKRLNLLTPLHVKLAEKGEQITGGNIYIAPGHTNTCIIRDVYSGMPVFNYTSRQFAEFNYPSVDCLMLSAAEVYGKKALGIILTGMGKDGTEGMKAIFGKGGYTVAQDEASSVIYGMPKSVVESGAAKRSVALEEIPAFIISCL
jgi:two-component system chemotaxis response regulator CheB